MAKKKKKSWAEIIEQRKQMVEEKDVFIFRGTSSETRAILNRIPTMDSMVKFIRNRIATPGFDTNKGLEIIEKAQKVIDEMNTFLSEAKVLIDETVKARKRGGNSSSEGEVAASSGPSSKNDEVTDQEQGTFMDEVSEASGSGNGEGSEEPVAERKTRRGKGILS